MDDRAIKRSKTAPGRARRVRGRPSAWALVAAVLGLLAAFPGHAAAWSTKIHRAIALAAQERLMPAAAARIREILGPGYGLADVAACADEIKRRPVRCGPLSLKVDRRSSGWHFVDIPISAGHVTKIELPGYCRNHGRNDSCSVAQIPLHLAVLRDAGASRLERQRALMFLVHLVGDLHQPLHNATDADSGGNGKLVRYLGRKKENLHHLWDDALLSDAEARRLRPEQFARELTASMPADTSSWTRGDVVPVAALESYAIARDKIYPAYYTSWDHEINRRYLNEVRPVAIQQLQKAVVRLAFLLNEALK